MNKHSYLSTWLVYLNNIKNYSIYKQYENKRHIGLNAKHFNKTANVTAAGNMNVHELCYLICVILMFIFDLKHKDIDLSALNHFSGLK